MGYDVHITRKKHWADTEAAQPITLEEWKALVDADPEMRLDNFAETISNNGDKIRIEREGLSVWTAFPGDGVDGNHAWFDYNKGDIVVKNPTDDIIDKMIALGTLLQADVVGDDGGYYLIREKENKEEQGAEESKTEIESTDNHPATAAKKAWWKLW